MNKIRDSRAEFMKIKPVLFNTDMVRAILDGRKTVTRRVVKQFVPDDAQFGYTAFTPKGCISARGIYEDGYGEKFYKLPYQPGDILYVRETWSWCPCWDCGHDSESGCTETPSSRFYNEEKREYGCYGFKASFADNEQPFDRWHPSIHMPKEAARIFLRVTSVRVERLHGMTEDDVRCEGFENPGDFIRLWDNTIKPADRERYGWAANPWVWVIKFERCGKPEEF